MWIYILAAVILVLSLLLCAPISVTIVYQKVGADIKKSMAFGIGIIRIPLPRAMQKKEKDVPQETEREKMSFQNVKKTLTKAYDVLQFLKKKFTVNLFSMQIRMGLGDAADTGIAVGAAYTFLYSFLGMVDRQFVLKKQSVGIEPVFNAMGFDIDFKGTFSLKIWHMIRLIMKIRKGDAK